ncbi:MAG: hypothetical protein LBK67_01435 [Coriobacteriales bacterium]|jgi:hypothetical protein|nr:hypothetical protein [Coriobacteriales bacterium]
MRLPDNRQKPLEREQMQSSPTSAKKRRWVLITLAITVVGILIGSGLAGCSSKSEPSNQVDETVPVASAPEKTAEDKLAQERVEERTNLTFSVGTYQVGVDFPAGQYYVNGLDPFEGLSTLEITTDSSGLDTSKVASDSFKGNSIVDLAGGQFITISNAEMYPIGLHDIELRKSVSDGFYRVGIDIPAGDYAIAPGIVGKGSFEVCVDARHAAESIVVSGSFQNSFTQTVVEGQYLKISEATAELVE